MSADSNSLFTRVWRRFVRCFLQGLLAILPLMITIAVVMWVVGFLESYLGPETFLGGHLSAIGGELSPNAALPYVVGWVAVLGSVFLIGLTVELGAKRLLRRWVDRVFDQLPLVGRIYKTSRQVIDMLDQQEEDALQGMSAVYCYWGDDKSTAVLAFLASPTIFTLEGRKYHVVIIPTAPIPFGGAMMFVPIENVVAANMPVEGLMSVYLSMGVSAAEYMKTTPVEANDTLPPKPENNDNE
ncbi:MAG: DUF502 domain-containing protein [Pirellulaceae bacterium]|nr:DUF502 domain-containing protein [Planctomycetaceae bacterium]HIM31347.1 DUF502 domain-containing protein [Planctomycetota bacterium]